MPPPRAPTIPQFARRLAIETPEHLVLELELAGVGSRIAAAACDAVLLSVAYMALGIGVATLQTRTAPPGPWSTLLAVLVVLAAFLVFWCYFLLFEALNHGRTPGKRLMGIRVVMDTGHPITFAAAAVRNLIRIVDALPFGLAGLATDRGRGTHHRRRRAVCDAKAGLLGGVSDARGTGGADRLEAAGGGRDSRVRGALSRGGGRSGARPDVRRGPQSARVSGARRERGAQRRLRPAHWPPRPHGPAGAPGAAGRRRGRARVRGDGPAHVRRSGDDRIRPDPGAPRDRGTGAHRRDAGACAGWRRASRPRGRLCAAALDVPAGHRHGDHYEQRASGVPGLRLRDHRRDRYGAAARVQRTVLRRGTRAVRELRTGRVAAHLRRRPRRARAVGDLHRRGRGAARRPGPARSRRPDPARCAGVGGPAGRPSGGSLRAAARAGGHDRGTAVRERCSRALQVRHERGDRRPADL